MSEEKEYLTDEEISKIQSFNQDTILVEAIRKVMLASIYTNGRLRKGKKSNPLTNAALGLASLAFNARAIVSDEQLGQDLRGLTAGIQLLEQGFKQLEKIKLKKDKPQSEENEA